jgi:hypothetical protein
LLCDIIFSILFVRFQHFNRPNCNKQKSVKPVPRCAGWTEMFRQVKTQQDIEPSIKTYYVLQNLSISNYTQKKMKIWPWIK